MGSDGATQSQQSAPTATQDRSSGGQSFGQAEGSGTSQNSGGSLSASGSQSRGSHQALGSSGSSRSGAQASVSPSEVREIQQALNQAGHDPGPIDGVWGQKTANALQEFQQAKGLQPSGKPDDQTIQALGVKEGGAGSSGSSSSGSGSSGSGGGSMQQSQ